jgi:hypothetical protein
MEKIRYIFLKKKFDALSELAAMMIIKRKGGKFDPNRKGKQ